MVIKILPHYFQALKIYKAKVLRYKGTQPWHIEQFGALVDLCLQNIIMWRNEQFLQHHGDRKEIIIDNYLYYIHGTLPVTWEVTRMHIYKNTMEYNMSLPIRLKIVLLYHLYLRGYGF